MSETNTPEPTMEEILASIRRIISEDDAPAAGGDSVAAAAATGDDVLELTDKVDAAAPAIHYEPEAPPAPAAAPAESIGDIDAFTPPPPISAAPEPPAPPAAAPEPKYPPGYDPTLGAPVDEPIVGEHAAQAAADRFSHLANAFALPPKVDMAGAGITLDSVVRELLRPMLKEWLDQHLEGIVDARVQAEVERISRRH